MIMKENDTASLRKAKNLLENPGLAIKISNRLGTPIEKGMEKLPKKFHNGVIEATQTALGKAADIAIYSMNPSYSESSYSFLHKIGVSLTGAAGGLFGLPALAVELPISTTIMLRSIADIARNEGEDIVSEDAKAACIQVFALGGPSKSDDAAEMGYFAVRAALSKSVAKAAEFIAEKGIVGEGAPFILRMIVQVAQRFSIQVTEKAAAQAIPLIGAAGGAAINALFIDHFQDMARGHFIVRRLERSYGADKVREAYLEL
jgi:hypothetical protein